MHIRQTTNINSMTHIYISPKEVFFIWIWNNIDNSHKNYKRGESNLNPPTILKFFKLKENKKKYKSKALAFFNRNLAHVLSSQPTQLFFFVTGLTHPLGLLLFPRYSICKLGQMASRVRWAHGPLDPRLLGGPCMLADTTCQVGWLVL